MSDKLPLILTKLASEQPSSDVLSLNLSRKMGDAYTYVVADMLPLQLSRLISEQPSGDALNLPLSRIMRTIDDVPIVPPPVGVDVNVAIIALAAINPTASCTGSYDANVFRGAIADVSGDFQQSRMTSINAQSLLEATQLLTSDTTANWQQSQLVGTTSGSEFEANVKLTISDDILFEQSKSISYDSRSSIYDQKLIGDTASLEHERSHLVGHSQYYSYESMLYRQMQRAICGDNAKLITHKYSTFSEYSVFIAQQQRLLIEQSRLPFNKLRYVPPELTQTVILKTQIIDGWECGSGDLRVYAYADEMVLPLYRRIADRGSADNMALPLASPMGVLMLDADIANALPDRPCNRKVIGVNPVLDITTCQPLTFGKRSGVAISGQTTLNAIALLNLLISDTDVSYKDGVIFVTNSVSLTRSDDGTEIKLLSFSVAIDSNSYTWSFSATVPLSELSKVNTGLEQQIGVNFNCNGYSWRFILDGCDDSIAFGERSLSIKGKSRAVLLASPYSEQRGYKFDTLMSARQIADAELNRNGVPSGFTLDWQLAGVNGWNVPANSYSYSNKTPINSLQWIAEAAGGFINADMSADILHVLERYPIAAWDWALQTPTQVIPQSIITSRSQSRANKPSYNGVTLYGENDGGVGALIKRTGTSGGYQPSMITSDLMTDNAAAISRGIAVLSDTGDIGTIGLVMPLHSDFGVLKPSTLIGVNDGEQWVGMVRGTSISGKLSSNRTLEIEQSLDIERHYDK